MKFALALAFALLLRIPAGVAQTPPALAADPPADRTQPAGSAAVRIANHGERMNALIYLPAGRGPHPVALLLHGFPGNEQNLDLAQAMRRAGWAVITFHYRGSWGSEGTFSFDSAVDDGSAVLAWAGDAANAQKFRLDPKRVVVLGHSMGGYVAAQVCAQATVLGCALIAPWDLSFDQRLVAPQSPAERDRTAATEFDDVDGRIAGMTAREVVEQLATRGEKWDLSKAAPGLAPRRLLIVLAAHDTDDAKAVSLLSALRAQHAASLRTETLDTDHAFNDRRIALERLVLEWLATLPGAPRH
ncbi:MAG TPA: alpha/beta fold hydrolase [Rudaea sp.]